MKLHTLKSVKGSKKKRKRIGRGPGSGYGKTAGRGEKGQKSRSGYSARPGFEGGQMPLIRRVPKRGFTNIFRIEYREINLDRLVKLKGELKEISAEQWRAWGLLRGKKDKIKILGRGTVEEPLTVHAHKFSRAAKTKIEEAGGSAVEIS
jgi:large subunit ribosomal protein L15